MLVDCGFPSSDVTRRLAALGREGGDISAILVTHEHGDHLRGVGPVARRHQLPVWMTPGTAAQWSGGELPELKLFDCHRPFAIDALRVQPYPVPHDAREPSQFLFSDGDRSFGVLTDVGHVTAHIREMLSGCDALMLECNHDSDMLAASAYPPSVRARIAGRQGHLSNDQAAQLLGGMDCSRLQHLVAAHLSEQNNCPDLVCATLSGVLGCEPDGVDIADQQTGLGWREIY